MNNVEKFLNRLQRNGTTPRYRRLARRQAYYFGTQFSHLHFDFEGVRTFLSGASIESTDYVKIRKRRPNVRGRLPKRIIRAFTYLLFGHGLKPQIVMEDDDTDGTTGKWLTEAMKQAQFWRVFQAIRNLGGATGSVAVTVKAVRGKFVIRGLDTKNLIVEAWEDYASLIPAVVWQQYPIEFEEITDDGRIVAKSKWIRRRWDTETETLWESNAIEAEKEEIYFTKVESIPHGLLRCPIVWISNEEEIDGFEIDGEPDIDEAQQETLDAYDRLSSQLTRAQIRNLDPTPVFKLETTKASEVIKGSDSALVLGPTEDAKYMEASFAGYEQVEKRLAEIKQDILDTAQAVTINPEKVLGTAMSGEAMRRVMGPMLDRANGFRTTYEPAILAIAEMMLAIGRNVAKSPELALDIDLDIGNAEKLRLIWPDWITPTPTETQAKVNNALGAKGQVVSNLTAIRYVGRDFGVEDAERELKEIEKERAALHIRFDDEKTDKDEDE